MATLTDVDAKSIATHLRAMADVYDPPISATPPATTPPTGGGTATTPPVTTPPATTPPVTTPPATTPPTGGGTATGPVAGFTGLDLGDATKWNQTPVFKDDFPTPVGGGGFAGVYKYWSVYPKGWTDTSKKGTYDPARISVVDRPDGVRALRQMVTANSDGTFGGCVVQPEFGSNGVGYIGSMRYSERVKLEQQDNGHNVLLGWPAKDTDWPKLSGEPDHYEYDTGNNPTIGGWLHVVGATTGSDHQVELPSDVKAYDAFHVVTIEQVAGKSYRRYIDGKLYNVVLSPGESYTAADNAAPHKTILPSGFSVPGIDLLRLCKQVESNGTRPTRGGAIVDTDWVVIQAAA